MSRLRAVNRDVAAGVPVKKLRPRPTGVFTDDRLHPVLCRIYAGRQVTSGEDLDYALDKLITPESLPGVEAAVAVLEQALLTKTKIVFVGDFDADGATSSALGVLALRTMGAEDVDYLVPNRFEFSYGLSPEIVQVAARMQPGLLITVDNGIANIDGVDTASRLGIPVVITDHHLPGEQLPAAAAIVNPNLADSSFPSSALAGVGVIFYLMLALRSRMREIGWFEHRPEPNLGDFLDLVALGTVADLVPLDRNNRILVGRGLQRINGARCRPGIRALLEFGRTRPGETSASDLGFVVAPRINAAGRLKDMSLGIECLLEDDYQRASAMAQELDELNKQRRQIESDMKSQALNIVDRMQLGGGLPAGICLYDDSWHQGVVGLIASRVKDRTGKPVVAFAKVDQVELKGSARSVQGLHMRDVLNAVHTRHPRLISRFGGHAAAAGLSLNLSDYDEFQAAFAAEVDKQLKGQDGIDVIYSDGTLDESEISIEFARLLKRSGPWGQGFPEPVFDDDFEVLERRVVGEFHLKLVVKKRGCSKRFDAIAFFQNEQYQEMNMDEAVRIVYQVDVNEYRGICKPQLIVRHIEPCAGVEK